MIGLARDPRVSHWRRQARSLRLIFLPVAATVWRFPALEGEALMDELVARVSAALGVDAGVARTGVGLVLGFLQKESPDGAVAEFLDKLPGAREAIDAAESSGAGAGGLGGLLSGMGGLMGLGAKLNGAGIEMGQIPALGHEIFGYAETKIGPEKLREIVDSIPGLAQFV
jgi:hypothetical protein